jgi:nucleoside-diphosphate-sugar epimerase
MSVLVNDINSVTNQKELFTFLDGSSVLVTGATGLIGSMIIRSLLCANKQYGLNIRLIGQIRNEEKAHILFGDDYDKIALVKEINSDAEYIIHTLAPTASKFFIEHPAETIDISVSGMKSVLEIARRCGSSVVYLSSMEQYGIPYEVGQIMTEDKIGIIDHLNVRSSYSESKRLCECMCAAYASEYGVDVKIARLSQTFGAGIPLTDNRMPIQFARSAVDGNDIVLHTEGKSISNFVYLTDALTGILMILKKGSKGEAYNICNDKETRSVREIAELVATKVASGDISVKIECKENMGYAPDSTMYLDSSKLQALGWNAEVDMEEAYKRLVQYIQGE